jgi:hypothetical protein
LGDCGGLGVGEEVVVTLAVASETLWALASEMASVDASGLAVVELAELVRGRGACCPGSALQRYHCEVAWPRP